MNTGIAGKDLMKQHYQIKNLFTKSFFFELYLKDITDEDYTHVKKLFEELKLKNLSDYHDLYVQSDTLQLADIFENFRNKCIEIYQLDPAHFLSAPGFARQACLKETGVELELLTNIDMLLMGGREIRGRIYHAIHRCVKANNKYKKNYDKGIQCNSIECNSAESSHLM